MATAPRMPAEQRREQLLDVAGDVILAEGFGAVSIDRIARDAKIARTVVYSQFDNLDGLFTALLERTERQALEQVRAVVPDLPIKRDPDAVLVDAILAFATVVVSHPRTWGLALLPVEGSPPPCATVSPPCARRSRRCFSRSSPGASRRVAVPKASTSSC